MDSGNFFDSLVDAENNDSARLCFDHFRDVVEPTMLLENFHRLSQELFVKPDGGEYEISPSDFRMMFESFDVDADDKLCWDEFLIMWSEFILPMLKPRCAMLVIDVQNDFIDGTLALRNCPAKQEGEEVVDVINDLCSSVRFCKVFYSLDWHPENHISFIDNVLNRKVSEDSFVEAQNAKVFDTVIFDGELRQEQKLWPKHCVQNSSGSELHKDLKLPLDAVPIYKGSNPEIDSYSAFWDNNKLSQTELYQKLKEADITHVFVSGLATDFCVGYTTVDSLDFRFRTFLVEDASRGVDLNGIQRMKEKINDLGGLIVSSGEVKDLVLGRDRRPELGLFAARSFRRGQS